MSKDLGKILIIDDIAENCDILQRRLDKVGYDTSSESDSNVAMETIKSGSFDIVLLDINMPGTSGILLLESIRKDKDLDQTAVIMITAIDDMQVALDCMQKGACGYLTKPFNIDQVRQQINNCFKINTD